MFISRCIFLLPLLLSCVLATHDVRRQRRLTRRDDEDPTTLYAEHYLKVPIDHWHNSTRYEPHTNDKYRQRYWYDDTYYKPGGPVIIHPVGEQSGTDVLDWMQQGMGYQLSKATGGLSVVLEHRYFGKSFPTRDLSTKNLRFLTTEQALADTVYFAKHVKFPGLNVSPEKTPWIAYGSSYSGAFAAFLRVTYPDVIYGAIGSSAVVEATYDFGRYFVPIGEYGPKDCIDTMAAIINTIDDVLTHSPKDTDLVKGAFGLKDLTDVRDFANVLYNPIGTWQDRSWSPDYSDDSFFGFCRNITHDKLIYSDTSKLSTTVDKIFAAAHTVKAKLKNPKANLKTRMLNFIGYMKVTYVDGIDRTPDEAFSALDASSWAEDDLGQWDWRSWSYLQCDEWGFWQTGSGIPADKPQIVSRLVDIPYSTAVCRDGFDIHRPANVSNILKYGGAGMKYPRLAFIQGNQDPYRDATVFKEGLPKKYSSTEEPYIVIDGGVHGYDEIGLFPNETTSSLPPKSVKDTQAKEREFVMRWLATGHSKSTKRSNVTSSVGTSPTGTSSTGTSSNGTSSNGTNVASPTLSSPAATSSVPNAGSVLAMPRSFDVVGFVLLVAAGVQVFM